MNCMHFVLFPSHNLASADSSMFLRKRKGQSGIPQKSGHQVRLPRQETNTNTRALETIGDLDFTYKSLEKNENLSPSRLAHKIPKLWKQEKMTSVRKEKDVKDTTGSPTTFKPKEEEGSSPGKHLGIVGRRKYPESPGQEVGEALWELEHGEESIHNERLVELHSESEDEGTCCC